MFQSICPIPFIQETSFSVKDVYVDGGIEYSATGKTRKTWLPLCSYQDILKKDPCWSNIRIIEGDPGTGKTIISLLLAHDWSLQIAPLHEFDVFIFLRLRHLVKTDTLFNAIKLLLLPEDTELTAVDIENIIKRSSSVILVLDGYDELSDSERPVYVKKILARQILQKLVVLVTTRFACFPDELSPLATRIRLTGFDDKAREKYMQKAVLQDNANAADMIKQSLQDNPMLADFFQVPFLFVMFSHISHEQNANIKFHSVTSFFQYMMTCFHSHQRNKYDIENDKSKSEDFERDHERLDKLAFESLSVNKSEFQWRKQVMEPKIGIEFLEEYLKIGILKEEEVLSYNQKKSTSLSQLVQRNHFVRFFHELFCEWYAAYFLAKEVERHSVEDLGKLLNKLDPLNVQYLYRFACGINQRAAEKIIQYLKRRRDGDEFAVLCILEQSGKVENIKDTVEELCKETIFISDEGTRLLQRSKLQLIDIASRVQVCVGSHVIFRNAFKLEKLQH